MKIKSIYLVFFVIVLSFFFMCSCEKKPKETAADKKETKNAKAASIEAAKESFSKLSKAVKAGNMDEAFKYISKEAKEEIDASGQVKASLIFMAGLKINHAEMKGDVAVLSERIHTRIGNIVDTTTAIPIYMIKEGGQWKVGPGNSIKFEDR